jgi:hypothetical protein
MLVFFEGCYLPAGRGLVGLVGLVFECSFPADVGVITNHQRQAGIGVWGSASRIWNLRFRI